MKFLDLLLEGRKEDFIKNYSRKFSKEDINRITNDFKPKYYDWIGKNLDPISINSVYNNLVTAMKMFDKISSNLKYTNINDYKSVDQLFNELKEYTNRTRRNYEQVNGANVVYDDKKQYIVFNPLTHDSSCYYGTGTKWCTTSKDPSNFNRYNMDGKLFYVLDRTKPSSDRFYKVAILKKYDGDVLLFDAIDDRINSGWILGTDEYENMLSAINNYLQTQFGEQIEIFSDKNRAELERRRLERLEIQRRNAQKIRDAEERRVNGEWNLDGDCPEIGLKAHALFYYLVRYHGAGDIEMDVYNLVPDGEHLLCTRFEVIDVEEFVNKSYFVGTEDEAYDSAYEHVVGLISDIGYEGFTGMDLTDYISEQNLRHFIKEMYEDHFYSYPEDYFSPEEMELSAYQENRLEQIDNELLQFRNQYNELEKNEQANEEELQDLMISISELEDEKNEILENPDGGISDEKIQGLLNDYYLDAKHDIKFFLENAGLGTASLDSLIDEKDFIHDVIDLDGYGVSLATYDGEAEQIKVQNQYFWVGRVD